MSDVGLSLAIPTTPRRTFPGSSWFLERGRGRRVEPGQPPRSMRRQALHFFRRISASEALAYRAWRSLGWVRSSRASFRIASRQRRDARG